jgi:hypothetical protein
MMSREDAQKIKNLKNEKSCKNCLKLGVCWLVQSIRCPMENHKASSGITMFDWSDMGKICSQYTSIGERIEMAENLL